MQCFQENCKQDHEITRSEEHKLRVYRVCVQLPTAGTIGGIRQKSGTGTDEDTKKAILMQAIMMHSAYGSVDSCTSRPRALQKKSQAQNREEYKGNDAEANANKTIHKHGQRHTRSHAQVNKQAVDKKYSRKTHPLLKITHKNASHRFFRV